MSEQVKSLTEKLATICSEIGAIGKTGKSSGFGDQYNYIEYGNVSAKIRKLFGKHKILFYPSVEEYSVAEVVSKKGASGYHYILRMKFLIINGENQEDRIERNWLSESIDYGDKGINKAETAGTKYFLMRLLQISEKSDDDPDSVSPEPAKKKNMLNFDDIREKVKNLETENELNAYWKALRLSEKQAAVLQPAFAKRKAEIVGVES